MRAGPPTPGVYERGARTAAIPFGPIPLAAGERSMNLGPARAAARGPVAIASDLPDHARGGGFAGHNRHRGRLLFRGRRNPESAWKNWSAAPPVELLPGRELVWRLG